MINNILFVCIGNICRSPMAEGLFREALPEKQFFSAGLDALIGYPADPFALQLLEGRGIDMNAHRARRVEGWMLMESDLILTMDKAQKHYIEQRYPVAQGKVARLGESLCCDVPDPYGQDRAAFENVFDLIEQCLEQWIDPLRYPAPQRRNPSSAAVPLSSSS